MVDYVWGGGERRNKIKAAGIRTQEQQRLWFVCLARSWVPPSAQKRINPSIYLGV